MTLPAASFLRSGMLCAFRNPSGDLTVMTLSDAVI
jgi:hypothetical protein